MNFPENKSETIQQDISHRVRTISRLWTQAEKNKVVRLSAIHLLTFGNFIYLSPIGKLKSLLQKEVVLLTIVPPVLLGKIPFFVYLP